jgi:ABC-type nitrate/sulfonate/bicarbonate transport system permease component
LRFALALLGMDCRRRGRTHRAPSGLGYAVEWYRELLMTAEQVMAFIATIGVLGYACDSIVRALGRWFTPWSVDVREA